MWLINKYPILRFNSSNIPRQHFGSFKNLCSLGERLKSLEQRLMIRDKSCFETIFCQKVVSKQPFQNFRKNYHGSEIIRIYILQLVHNCHIIW